MGWVVSFGTGCYFAFILYPSLNEIDDRLLRMRVLARSLRYYHPIYLFGLCLSFMTGAMMMTALKINLGASYFDKLLAPLGWKFLFVLLVFNVAAMQCFGQGLKLGRMAIGVIPGDIETQERYARKIRKTQIFNLGLILVTVYFGYRLHGVIGL